MTYTTPVYDRTQSDIVNRTSKGYFNVADWTRIYNNAEHINGMAEAATGASIDFTTITAPTRTSFPTIANLNALIENIDNVRAAVPLASVEALRPLKHDWEAGAMAKAVTWRNVNDWERYTATIYNALAAAQTEMIVNGSFSGAGWPSGEPAEYYWQVSTAWLIEDENVFADGVETGDHLVYMRFSPTVGKTYRVTFTISGYSSGGVVFHCGADGTNRTADGTYTEYITATDNYVFFSADTSGTFTGAIDDVSVVKML